MIIGGVAMIGLIMVAVTFICAFLLGRHSKQQPMEIEIRRRVEEVAMPIPEQLDPAQPPVEAPAQVVAEVAAEADLPAVQPIAQEAIGAILQEVRQVEDALGGGLPPNDEVIPLPDIHQKVLDADLRYFARPMVRQINGIGMWNQVPLDPLPPRPAAEDVGQHHWVMEQPREDMDDWQRRLSYARNCGRAARMKLLHGVLVRGGERVGPRNRYWVVLHCNRRVDVCGVYTTWEAAFMMVASRE
jgi:hypothetical protein